MLPHLQRFLLLALTVVLLGVECASANLADVLPELGNLQQWSVFALGSNSARSELAGDTYIQGDVGIAGAGDITLKDNATIQGNLYCRSSGTLKTSYAVTITGAEIDDQNGRLDNDSAAAIATMRHAAGLKPTVSDRFDLELRRNQNFTTTGAPGETVVMKLANFVIGGHSTFTLEGTETTTFIINVTKQFSLSGNASIILSGAVQWSNVLFNISAKDSAVSLSGNSSFAGILMANRRKVKLADHAHVTGEVIANRVMFRATSVDGNASVGHPPLVSP